MSESRIEYRVVCKVDREEEPFQTFSLADAETVAEDCCSILTREVSDWKLDAGTGPTPRREENVRVSSGAIEAAAHALLALEIGGDATDDPIYAEDLDACRVDARTAIIAARPFLIADLASKIPL